MAIAQVGNWTSAQFSSSTGGSLTGRTSTKGNLVVIVALSTDPAFTITHSQAGTVKTAQSDAFLGGQIRIAYIENIVGGASHTITLTAAAASNSFMNATEYSGIISSGSLDKVNSGTGTSTALLSAATATTAQPNELIIGGGANSDATSSAWTAGASFNLRGNLANGLTGACGFLEDRIVAARGAYTSSATWSGGSSAWVCQVATFIGATDEWTGPPLPMWGPFPWQQWTPAGGLEALGVVSSDLSTVGVLFSGAPPYAPATHDTTVAGHLPAAAVPYSPVSHNVSTVAHLPTGTPQISASGFLAYIVVGHLASGAPLFAPISHDVPVAGHLASGAPQYGPISHNISVAGHLPTGTVSYSPVTHDTSVAGHLASGSVWYALVSGSSDVNVVGVLFSGTALYGPVSHTTSVPALLTVGTDLRGTVSHTTSVVGHLSTGTFPLAVVSHNVSLVGYLTSGTALYAIAGAFGAIPTITYPTAFVVLPNSRLGVDLAPSGLTVELASSSLIFVAGPSGLLVPLTPPNENLDLS